MKVLYDHQIFELQKFGGISRYVYELIAYIGKSKNVEHELAIKYSNNEYLKNSKEFKDSISPIPIKKEVFPDTLLGMPIKGKRTLNAIAKRFTSKEPSAKYTLANKNAVIEKLKKGDFDVFHPTYYDPYFLDYIGQKPFVITVLDLIHEVYPEYSLRDVQLKNKEVFQKAAKIIAISESTKNDLVSLLGIDPGRIEVVYLGNSLEPSKAEPSKFKEITFPYLLFVGNRTLYKNFYFFAQVFSSMPELRNFHLVCTGSPLEIEENFFLDKLGIRERVHHFFVNDGELSHLYKNAHAFVFPSLYEGFGIPLLEAFSCGCPVLASNTSSLTEIGGDAVLYFEPKGTESMKGALLKITSQEDQRQQLIRKGYERVKYFSWEATAKETLMVYEKAIKLSTL